MLFLSALALADTFVLVRDATLMRAGQQQVKLVAPEGAVAMRLVEDQGAQFVVSPLHDTGGHCYAGGVDPDLDLRLWISKDDVWPVLRSDYASPDGAVVVRAGARADMAAKGTWTVKVDGAAMTLAVPFATIGDRYDVVGGAPGGATGTTTVQVAGFGAVTTTWPSGATVAEAEGAQTVTGRCLSLRGVVERSTPAIPAEPLPSGGARFSVPAGTPLTWPDGSPAGSVLSDSVVTLADPAHPRVCVATTLAGAALRPCLDKKAITPIPLRPGRR